MAMKVLLVNGSPNKRGCTYTALAEVAGELEKSGIETEIFHVGKTVQGCTACKACRKLGRCVTEDLVNKFAQLAQNADGFVFGSPTYFAGPSGQICSFMDRLFFAHGRSLRLKPACAVVSARRGGTTANLDRLNKYFAWAQMPVISSVYWNMVHGNTPDEVAQDHEGLQTMRILGSNMAYMLKCIDAGEKSGVQQPEQPEKIWTSFVR